MGIRTNLKPVSLRQKLMLTSIACLVLPAIGMLYTTGVYSKIIIREHTLGKAMQSLMIVQSQVEAILEEIVSISNFVQFDPEIKTLLEEAKGSPVAARQLTTRLEQIAGEKRDLRLTLLTRDGRAYSDYSFYDFEPQRFFRQDWFSRAERLTAYETLFLGGLENYLPPLYPEQKYVYMTARALTETLDHPPFAYLIVSRTENSIRELFAGMEEDVFLLDENDRILSNRNAEWIGDRFGNVLPREALSSPEIIHVDGENQLFLSLPLRFAGWRLVSVAPYEQLTEKLNGLYRTMLFLQAMFAIGFLLALTYLLRRFTKPVLALGEAAKKVESGDLNVRSNIRGPDEIGRLGRSFDFMLDRIQQILAQVKMEQELKRQAEMALLQAQVHPHFLFNVLSSIRLKLLMKGDEETALVVGSLSSLLRASLSKQDEFVALYAEIETAKQYTDLMKFAMRFPIETRWEIHGDPFSVAVPRFILQPIIENAYKHGFAQNGGRISIKTEAAGSALRITVEDNGLGMTPETLAELEKRLNYRKRELIEQMISNERVSPSGIGLYNVYSRLKLVYGERFEMKIQSVRGRRTTVELLLPIGQEEEGGHHV
ncbi:MULTISPECIES: sensor histidine kinase [Cohnella]|uniref:sensor histidine kinase n=1 Tax=Cohnella TaxID=329857 RepID=UPI0009B97F40|nr:MULTISPECIES: sensor histidine kinase [Cohnella]MBN2984703.1 histidine kinase [Cohnella algarum]